MKKICGIVCILFGIGIFSSPFFAPYFIEGKVGQLLPIMMIPLGVGTLLIVYGFSRFAPEEKLSKL